MPGADGGTPAGDRQQRHVDRLKIRHPVEQVGVSGEVHGSMSGTQHVADRRSADPAVRPPSRRVGGGNGLDRHRTEDRALTDGRFDDVAESVPSQQPSRPGRHDHLHVAAEQAQ